MSDKITAVVLAAGRGRRMGSGVRKQYMQLAGQPLICHALRAFEQSGVDDIVLVCGPGEEEYCRRIADAYGFTKIGAVVLGGEERCDSVYAGLEAAAGCGYVLIHDGARPCVTGEIIRTAIEGAKQYGACVIAMPVKDTIRVADAEGFSVAAPPRRSLWQMQTPQAFAYPLVREAYRRFFSEVAAAALSRDSVTDDAMVVERFMDRRVRLLPGSYENIKVTTPEDMAIAETFLKKRITV